MAATKLKCKSDARVLVNEPIETIESPDRIYIADSRFKNPPSDRMKNVTAPATSNPRLELLRRERPRINGQAEPSKTASEFSRKNSVITLNEGYHDGEKSRNELP